MWRRSASPIESTSILLGQRFTLSPLKPPIQTYGLPLNSSLPVSPSPADCWLGALSRGQLRPRGPRRHFKAYTAAESSAAAICGYCNNPSQDPSEPIPFEHYISRPAASSTPQPSAGSIHESPAAILRPRLR